MLMDSLNREKPEEQLYREEEKEGWVNEGREGSQSLPNFCPLIPAAGREGGRLITAETIPDQTSVSNCPANREEPDMQRNQWSNLEGEKYFAWWRWN